MSAPHRATSKYDAEINAALNRALAHPLRHRMLAIMDERPSSPTELAKQLGEPREKIIYHVNLLAGRLRDDAIPLIELVRTDGRHGGVEHFYRPIVRPVVDTPAAEKLSRLSRESLSATGIDLVIGDVLESFEAGVFDSHAARSLLRMHIEVDDPGFKKVGEILERSLLELSDVEAESKQRLGGEPGIPVAAALLAFPKP